MVKQRYLTVPKAFLAAGLLSVMTFMIHSSFQYVLELDTTFRGETDAKGGQDIIAFGDPVHINVKIRSE